MALEFDIPVSRISFENYKEKFADKMLVKSDSSINEILKPIFNDQE